MLIRKELLVALFTVAGCAAQSTIAKPAPYAINPGPDAQTLAMRAATCWLGPVWLEAVGVPQTDRADRTTAACDDVALDVYGQIDPTRVQQLRAFEQNTIDDVIHKVAAIARSTRGDDDAHDLTVFVGALADAQREAMWARRAADKIKLDTDFVRGPNKLTNDEIAAVRPIASVDSLRGLLNADAGRYTRDAHALGVITATDRMELARDLPKHMKLFAITNLYRLMFDAKEPTPPAKVVAPAQPGVWLTALTEGARAAGHPVPDVIADPKERNIAAWSGVLEGFADLLATDAPAVTGTLQPVVAGVLERLRAEATNARNRLEGDLPQTETPDHSGQNE